MNIDVRDLVGRINLKDPVSVGGVVTLAVATILFAVTTKSLILSVGRRAELQATYDTAQDTIARAQEHQRVKPEELRHDIAEAQTQLLEMLSDFPSGAQANDELSHYYQYANDLDVQLMRMEALAVEPEHDDHTIYSLQRFLLEAEGEVPNLMRFLAQVGAGPYLTFSIDNVTIQTNETPLASAELTVLASDLGLGATPRPAKRLSVAAPLPTPDSTGTADLLSMESQMMMAMAANDWPNAVEYGRRILAQSPDRPGVVQALYRSQVSWAHELVSHGRYVEAREQFEAALGVIPEGVEALEGLRQLEAASKPGH